MFCSQKWFCALSLTLGTLLTGLAQAESPVVISPSAFQPSFAAHGEKQITIFQHKTLSKAWKTSKKTGRPMLLFISMNGCHYCEQMNSELYASPTNYNIVGTEYESVKLKKNANAELIKKLKVRVFPTTLVVLPSGKIIDRIDGYLSPENLTKRIQKTKRTASIAQP